MLRPIRFPLAALLAISLVAPAIAEDCEPGSSDPEIVGPTCAVGLDLCFYVENDPCGGGSGECLFSIWVYQETNGIPGLQRGDEIRDDTCGGRIDADTIIF